MPVEESKGVSSSSVSARIIAAGIVIAFCYWASTILMTLLVSVLLAYFLDPVVTWLERIHIPRALGSLIIVLVTVAMLAVMGYSLMDRADQFSADWPKYRAPLQKAAAEVESKMESVEKNVSEIEQGEKASGQAVTTREESHTVRDLLVGRLSSLYEFVLAATFVPFLLFFMLAAKRQVWHATMQLFAPGERTAVRDALSEVTQVLRSYLMGTALVGLVLVIASSLFFWMMGLDFPFLTGLVSGICNLVPYLGVIMSWVPPLLVGLKKYSTVTPFLGIFAFLTVMHIVTANLLIPALVGWRVRLNALALTIALLFWGWLWGAMGLILAIPITAVLKVVCDHVESLQPVGRWLSA
jgi:predicted PurR-regulated permease PerM